MILLGCPQARIGEPLRVAPPPATRATMSGLHRLTWCRLHGPDRTHPGPSRCKRVTVALVGDQDVTGPPRGLQVMPPELLGELPHSGGYFRDSRPHRGNELTWMTTDRVIRANRAPLRPSRSSVREQMARPARAPPRASEPVSPRNLAGEVFHHRNPKHAAREGGGDDGLVEWGADLHTGGGVNHRHRVGPRLLDLPGS